MKSLWKFLLLDAGPRLRIQINPLLSFNLLTELFNLLSFQFIIT